MFEEEDNIPVQISLQIGMNKLSVQHDILVRLDVKQSKTNWKQLDYDYWTQLIWITVKVEFMYVV